MFIVKKLPIALENRIFYFLEHPVAKIFKHCRRSLIILNNRRKWFDYDYYMTRKYINVPPIARTSPCYYYRDSTYNQFYSARMYQKRVKELNKKFAKDFKYL